MGAESNITGLVFDVTASWSSAGELYVAQWTLQRSTDLGVTWSSIAVLPEATHSYVDHNVPHVELWYRVIAQNSVGQTTAPSSRVHLPFPSQAPKATNVDVPDHPIQIPAQVDLTWTAPVNIVTIETVAIQIVQRSIDKGLTWVDVSPSLLPTVGAFRDTRDIFAQLMLSWSGWTWAVQYRVERSPDGVAWTALTTTTALTYTDITPFVNQYSHYRVVGINSVGETIGPSVGMWLIPEWDLTGGVDLLVCTEYEYRILWINNVGVTPGQTGTNTTNPPVLQLVATTTEVPLAITIAIRPPPTGNLLVAPPFNVERDTDVTPQVPALTLSVVQDPTYTDTAIVHGHKYTYAVTALTGIGYTSPYIALYSAGPVPPLAPKVVQDPLLPYVDVFWLPAYQATTYHVERSIDLGVSYQRLASGLVGCFWADTDILSTLSTTAATQVRYRIVSADDIYESIGDVATLSNYMVPPTLPTLTIAAGQITVAWTAPANTLILYDVQRRTPDSWAWSTIHTTGGASGGGLHNYSYIDTAMTAYQRYYYRIYARNTGSGENVASLAVSTVYKAPGDPPGYRIVVNGVDVSPQVERGSALKVDAEITQKGGTAGFVLDYDPTPPQILTR